MDFCQLQILDNTLLMCTPCVNFFFKRRIHFRVLAKLFGLEVCLVYFSETGFFVKQALDLFTALQFQMKAQKQKKVNRGGLKVDLYV